MDSNKWEYANFYSTRFMHIDQEVIFEDPYYHTIHTGTIVAKDELTITVHTYSGQTNRITAYDVRAIKDYDHS